MIQKFQALKAKKGFTMIELIVVIAIMAVLMAIIFPMLTSDRSRKQEANFAARDFYAAVQTVMTKYSMYEGPLSPAYQSTPNLGEMKYFEKLGGNFPFRTGSTATDIPNTTSLYIEIATKGGAITEIYTYAIESSDAGYADGAGLYHLCTRDASMKGTEFGNLLKAELEKRISYNDGFYYAKVTYKNIMTSTIPARMEAETVKVEYSGYCRHRLPNSSSITFADFKNKNMYFGDDNKLVNGDIFGICAPLNTTGKTVGLAGSTLS